MKRNTQKQWLIFCSLSLILTACVPLNLLSGENDNCSGNGSNLSYTWARSTLELNFQGNSQAGKTVQVSIRNSPNQVKVVAGSNGRFSGILPKVGPQDTICVDGQCDLLAVCLFGS